MNIGIYIYNKAEVLDFSGPFEVFSTASRLSHPAEKFQVFLIAETMSPVIARGGFSVNPHYDFHNHPTIDVLLISGGVHNDTLANPTAINWVANMAKNAQIVASVCTGAFILAETGMLSGLEVTTHWEDIDDLSRSYPQLTVVSGQRWIDTGKFITSGGISSGIDMSLYLVSRLASPTLAEKTAKQMEFSWSKTPQPSNLN